MKLGIKTGLKSDWKTDLGTTRPEFCELWFHSGKIPAYTPLLTYCKEHKIKTGLHFWGILEGSIQSNLSYPDENIRHASVALVKQTIDVAHRENSWYVNVHPGEATLTRIDFDKEVFEATSTTQPLRLCQEALKKSVTELSEYAKARGVPLCIESVPKHAPGSPWHGTESRKKPVQINQIPIECIEPLLGDNVFFANDFGHTAGHIDTNSRSEAREYLFNIARRLAPQTKLLHISYIIPPYNGTDYHGCLYYPEFLTDAALPNKFETLELLQLFKNRDDIYALVEPEIDHIGNFKSLQTLIGEIS